MAGRIMMKSNKKSAKTVREAVEEFLEFKEAENLSPKTLSAYKYNISRFEAFLDEKNICLTTDINEKLIISFMVFLKKKIANQSSINNVLRENKVFLLYCMKKGYIETFSISIPKEEEKLKDTYSLDELERLLEKPDVSTCRFSTYRNWVLVNYMMGTGQRAGTIRNLKIGDIDLKAGEVILRKNKNNKQRIRPLPNVLVEILKEYLGYRGGEPEDYLFCSELTGKQFTVDGLKSAIARYNHSRGVSKTSTHLYRHTFAKQWIKNGGDPFSLQKMLDHSDLETTKLYISMFSDDLKKCSESFNPLERLAPKKHKRMAMSAAK